MKLRVLGLLSFFALAACNESSIPAFSGRLVNQSSIPSESFEITYVLSCKKESLVGPRPSCGYDSKTAKVDANGNYSMPALEVNSGGSMYDLKIEVRSHQ